MAYQSSKPYPYLPEGKEIKYVAADNPYMLEAKHVCRELSTESVHPTGAVIVKDGKIIGRGANQAAIKNSAAQRFHKNYLCIRRLFKIPSGRMYWLCPGCAQFRHHAEVRAVKNAKSNHAPMGGADLYMYGHWWCCKPCWDKMLAEGINNVCLVEGATELFSR